MKDERDWEEDFAQENGNYENSCWVCHYTFRGNKGRLICRVCRQSAAIKRNEELNEGKQTMKDILSKLTDEEAEKWLTFAAQIIWDEENSHRLCRDIRLRLDEFYHELIAHRINNNDRAA